MRLVDFEHPDIERPVGDRWGRTPHYTYDADGKDPGFPGVLYVPAENGAWRAKAFFDPQKAIEFLERQFEPYREAIPF